MSDIVVIGSLNMDLVTGMSRMPLPGETLHGEYFRMIPGGKGANQAVAISRLGGNVTMVGRVGQDVFGSHLTDNLRASGVSTEFIFTDTKNMTGTATILVDDKGENSIIVIAGANGHLCKRDIETIEPRLAEARYLVTQLEIPLATVSHAIKLARKYALKIILNPAPAYPQAIGFFNFVDYLILNETEASILSGIDVINHSKSIQACSKLLSFGVPNIILTLGDKGVFYATNEHIKHYTSHKVNVVDTTAAGDAFIGAFTTALIKGFPIEEAIEFSNCAGALAVSKLGAQTSLPTADELNTFYENVKQ